MRKKNKWGRSYIYIAFCWLLFQFLVIYINWMPLLPIIVQPFLPSHVHTLKLTPAIYSAWHKGGRAIMVLSLSLSILLWSTSFCPSGRASKGGHKNIVNTCDFFSYVSMYCLSAHSLWYEATMHCAATIIDPQATGFSVCSPNDIFENVFSIQPFDTFHLNLRGIYCIVVV